ncbi:MAG: hypothetical protein LBQ07_02355 [Endomicrobium sp.]|jgi:chromosomal replication initiator protein|nr:hypothetical protein [Endomicrobium sp.]
MDVSVFNLWQKITNDLKLLITSETDSLWISPVEPLSFKNNIFTLQFPNIYFLQLIINNQQKNIEHTLLNFCDQSITLKFKFQENILQKKEEISSNNYGHIFQFIIKVQKDHINPKYFFVGLVGDASNRFAHVWSESVAKSPGKQFNHLFMYSGVVVPGKAHLFYAIDNYVKKNSMPNLKVLCVTCEKFVTEFIESIRFDKVASFKSKYRNLDCLLIDDIQPPDLERRIAIFKKKYDVEKIYIPNDVNLYTTAQIKSNIRQLKGSLLKITAFSLFTVTPLTVDSVRKMLKDIIKIDNYIHITIKNVQKIVLEDFNINIKDMQSKRRTNTIAFPKQIAMYLTKTLTDKFSTSVIDYVFFGKRNRSTVMHACNKIKDKITSDLYFNAKINQIIKNSEMQINIFLYKKMKKKIYYHYRI